MLLACLFCFVYREDKYGKIIFKDTADTSLVKAYGKNLEITIKNGNVDFSKYSKTSVNVNLTSNRTKNFSNADEAIANMWNENPDSIPENIKEYFSSKGVDVNNYNFKKSVIKNMRSELQLTWHEAEDCATMYLVDTYLHSKVSHFGGVGTVRILEKYKIGTIYLNNLLPSV